MISEEVWIVGKQIVRDEETDWHTRVVVATNALQSYSYEWALIHRDRVAAESYAGYSSPAAALRDGLLYENCGKILLSGETCADPSYLGLPEWITEHANRKGG